MKEGGRGAILAGDQLVAVFRREDPRREHDSGAGQDKDAPANGAVDPGGIKLPAHKEPIFLIEGDHLDSLERADEAPDVEIIFRSP